MWQDVILLIVVVALLGFEVYFVFEGVFCCINESVLFGSLWLGPPFCGERNSRPQIYCSSQLVVWGLNIVLVSSAEV